jgi:hypothetical protein
VTRPLDAGATTDLVAFEVEGSGCYLVPLDLLATYEVAIGECGRAAVLLGWGWSLPIVRWNTFHSSQLGAEIALGPGVTARLAAHHFLTPNTEGTEP